MGSRRTHDKRMARLAEAGVTDAAELDRLHSPIGLDIGARTPEETAMSICAEIIAQRTGRRVPSLRDSQRRHPFVRLARPHGESRRGGRGRPSICLVAALPSAGVPESEGAEHLPPRWRSLGRGARGRARPGVCLVAGDFSSGFRGQAGAGSPKRTEPDLRPEIVSISTVRPVCTEWMIASPTPR